MRQKVTDEQRTHTYTKTILGWTGELDLVKERPNPFRDCGP